MPIRTKKHKDPLSSVCLLRGRGLIGLDVIGSRTSRVFANSSEPGDDKRHSRLENDAQRTLGRLLIHDVLYRSKGEVHIAGWTFIRLFGLGATGLMMELVGNTDRRKTRTIQIRMTIDEIEFDT
ncbi:hypothetical protein M231_05816 [Tremella mesenterica]|uniref:Uncharacterized protein n=1 Tax=Tremella mesenterica TaxID=5217 RepID=A0A4Q1BH47_TREME|nr:hypothetical protein M231_05816 [Tremella mesenterica]